jgi:integrase
VWAVCCAELIARVLSIPEKRYESTLISYLTDPEIDALLAAPDRSTWTGRRDHALLLVAAQTGLRASELASLRCEDLNLDAGWVRCQGKQKGKVHAAQPHRQAGAARLAARTRRRSRWPLVPKPHQRAPDAQRDLAPRCQAHRHRAGTVPIPDSEKHHSAQQHQLEVAASLAWTPVLARRLQALGARFGDESAPVRRDPGAASRRNQGARRAVQNRRDTYANVRRGQSRSHDRVVALCAGGL